METEGWKMLLNKLQIRKLKFPLILTTGYSLLAAIFTWPLVKNLSSSVYGYPGDNFGYIYYLWWWKYSKLQGLDFHWMPLQEAPFGMPILPDSGGVVYFGVTKALTWLTNEVAGYNLTLLATFPLAGLFAYLLAFKISKNRWASFLAGFIFAFCPYHLWRAYNHLDLAMIQWIPFFFWALIGWLEKRNWRWGLAAGVGYSLIMLTNYYYAFFGFFAALVLMGVYVVPQVVKKGRKYFDRSLLVSCLTAVAVPAVCTLVFVMPAVRQLQSLETSLVGDLLQRPFDSLIGLSARPWDYLLPSSDHPVLGGWSQRAYDWIATLTPDWRTKSSFRHERVLFLGFYTIIFSLLAIGLRIRKKIVSKWFGPLLASAIVMFLFSMPPLYYWRGVTLYFPSYFLHPLLPMFRTYTRAGVFVLLFAVTLASLGTAHIFKKVKTKKARCFLFSVFGLLILFEFLNFPPAKVTDFSEIPPEYEWLAQQPGDFIYAEYPKEVNIAEIQMFQRYHLRPFMNFHDLSPNFKVWDRVWDIYDPATPSNLAALGVKYILARTGLLFEGSNPVDDLWWTRKYQKPLEYERIPGGFELVKQFPKADIFEVVVEVGDGI